MKTHIISIVLALLALPAAAQTLSPTPTPGLWETDSKMTVNGQDLGALMRQSMQAAMKKLPADQRAMAEQMMKGQAMPGGKQQSCLTPAEAAKRGDARTALAELQRESPTCRYEPVKVAGATMSFKGRCEDPEGFTGDITGEFKMTDAKAWTGRWAGTGLMAQAESMPGLKVPPDGRMQFGWVGSGRWLAGACGAVKPE